MSNSLRSGKSSLETMRSLDRHFGYPSRAFRSIHIAGTNGKGSVAHALAASLPGKVGLFTSPHVAHLRERVQLDGVPIPDPEPILAEITSLGTFTFFETMTMLAFLYFARSGVEMAVCEVGMGGRLDATNILMPELTIITSLGLDHTHILGETLELIAQEKGGIIKPGVPLVVGPTADVYADCASPYYPVRGPFAHFGEENTAIAHQACQILGITPAPAVPLCCFELWEGPVVLDIAHNPPALKALIARLQLTFPGKTLRIVAGFAEDKAIEEMTALLTRYARSLHLTQGKAPRAAKLSDQSPLEAFETARALCTAEDVLVVCGTVTIMDEIRSRLGACSRLIHR